MLPTVTSVAEVGVPGDAGPVEFQALYVKFSGNVLKVIRRAHVFLAVEKPVNRILLAT